MNSSCNNCLSSDRVIGIDVFTMDVQLPLSVLFAQYEKYWIYHLACDVVEFRLNDHGFARYSISRPYEGGGIAKLKKIEFYGNGSVCAVRQFWNMAKDKSHLLNARILWSDGHIDKMYAKLNEREYVTIEDRVFGYLANKLKGDNAAKEGKRMEYIEMMRKYLCPYEFSDKHPTNSTNYLSRKTWTGEETEDETRKLLERSINNLPVWQRWG